MAMNWEADEISDEDLEAAASMHDNLVAGTHYKKQRIAEESMALGPRSLRKSVKWVKCFLVGGNIGVDSWKCDITYMDDSKTEDIQVEQISMKHGHTTSYAGMLSHADQGWTVRNTPMHEVLPSINTEFINGAHCTIKPAPNPNYNILHCESID